jgi:hypothetical protein
MIGQSISVVSFSLAQRLGFQEKGDETDPLHRRLELNAARWDLFVLWTLPIAGILILTNHAWWPCLALIAGAIHLDAGGREIAKIRGLRAHGVRTGSAKDLRLFLIFMGSMALIGLWCITIGLGALL